MISTRVYYGSVEPAYGDKEGGDMLEKKGAILAGDLMGTKARLLLMLAMAEVGNNFEKLKNFSNSIPPLTSVLYATILYKKTIEMVVI